MAFAYPRKRDDELDEPVVQGHTECPKCGRPMLMGVHTGTFICDDCQPKPKKRGRPPKVKA